MMITPIHSSTLCTSEHVVQIHHDLQALIESVSVFALSGLNNGDTVMLAGCRSHPKSIEASLGSQRVNTLQAKERGRLIPLDAEEALSTFMVDGMPDWKRFEGTIGTAIRDSRSEVSSVQVWGEMVNQLWEQDRVSAAIRLEEMWNELARTHPFSLFCTYLMEPLNSSGPSRAMLVGAARTHSRVVPAGDYGCIEAAVEMAMDEVLGPSQSGMVRTLVRTKADLPQLPNAQMLIFWLQANMPLLAEKVIDRGREIYTRMGRA